MIVERWKLFNARLRIQELEMMHRTVVGDIMSMLEAIEFCAGYFEPHCPVCWGRRGGGHSDKCKLGNLIKKVVTILEIERKRRQQDIGG